ncbi:MAG TPA: MerR family transcriptional regulator [Flavisolibacter sp.]|jgi:DNA-binding transcriptional MerR regulator|nr:MerR family transcriptional regulator [Flavisolibacter sp.]
MGFTIKELEILSGVKAHTIRIWEQRYQFLKPSRTSTNIRRYSNDELKTLLTVALLNKYGYKISKIDGMQQEQRDAVLLKIPGEEVRTEYMVNELIGCMIDLNAESFEDILQQHIEDKGIVLTITSLLFRFLDKIGILWQTGRINPAHEHIVTNIIRQKLFASIDALPRPTKKQPLLMLLLPEGQHHELGLIFVSYLLRKAGLTQVYLGANIPLKDADYMIEMKKPHYVYCHLTTLSGKLDFKKFVDTLSTNHPKTSMLLSGIVSERVKPEAKSNVILLQSLPEVVAYISKL